MTDSTQSAVSSGRDLARARRLEMSRTGGAKIKAGQNRAGRSKPAVSSVSTAVAQPVINSSQAAQSSSVGEVAKPASSNGANMLTGRELSKARRAMLAKEGRRSLPSTANVGRVKNKPAGAVSLIDSKPAEACCDACAEGEETAVVDNDKSIDAICDLIDTNSGAAINASSSVRAICRERRNTLSKKGKLGLPGKAGSQARKSVIRSAVSSSLTGRELSKMRREDRCAVGRGDSQACRPSGRVRKDFGAAPDKVEIGTTLSGQSVSGTQVESTEKVTGVESGACRAITGTEYLGVEQFENFCSSIPRASAPKVGFSETGKGQILSGSSTAGNSKVTGEETGSCKSVTGSEYLGSEHFEAFCSSLNMSKAKEKVVMGATSKNLSVTGADESRDNAVTGSEAGSNQRVTGSEYSNTAPRLQAKAAPIKVGESHTAAGVPVSGGESSRTSGITGDDQDICRRVTGTEYVSSERFQTVCGSAPEQSIAKVGVDSSRGGMSITGNLVDRSERVTGNEPGSCQSVTGSQYGEPAKSGYCNQRSNKVHEMHTLHGGAVTGTEASSSPKLTGDDRGSCSAVTGSEYVSQEFFKKSCSQVPLSSAQLSAPSQTWKNQMISGVQTGIATNMTGNDQGVCNTVTGNDYIGREQVGQFCDALAVSQNDQRMARHDNVAAVPVSGITPAIDERMSGNFRRGVCQGITGTPYQDIKDRALCNSGARHHIAQSNTSEPIQEEIMEVYKSDFSVTSPAKSAWTQKTNEPVHSSVYAQRNSITGAINKAEGVISGTPEFRHERVSSPAISAVKPVETEVVERITGEGSESGVSITGDDWSRGGSVTGTEGLFSSSRNQTQQGASVKRTNIGAYALKNKERPEVAVSKVTGGGGSTCNTGLVTLSGGASA